MAQWPARSIVVLRVGDGGITRADRNHAQTAGIIRDERI